MKKKKQIEEWLARIGDLCWLHRSYLLERNPELGLGKSDTPAEIEAGMIVARARIEMKYGVKVPDDDVELMEEHERLTVELATLRWVLDKDVEWREAGLGDT